MSANLIPKILVTVVGIVATALLPVIPIDFVLRDDLPSLEADDALAADDVEAIVTEARGGKFVNLVGILIGTVNEPFTGVSIIDPENIPYDGSVEDRSDVVVGHGTCIVGSVPLACSGYRVYLRREGDGWEVVERVDYIT